MTMFIMTQNRAEATPQNGPIVEKTRYYQFTPEVARKLRKAKLTRSEWELWSYLTTLDPFGDRYVQLPTLKEVLAEVEISKATFYRAIAKLQEHDLIDFQVGDIRFRNLLGRENSLKNATPVSKMRKLSQKCDTSLKNEKTFAELRLDSQNCENRSPKPPQALASRSPHTLQTLQTDPDTLKPQPSVCFEENNQKPKEVDQEKIADQRSPVKLTEEESCQRPLTTKRETVPDTSNDREKILWRAKKIGVNFGDRKLKQAIAAHPDRLEQAVTTLVEKSETVRYPTRFLERAILEAWEPETKQNLRFSQWFDEAKRQDCEVLGGQIIDDVQWVYASGGQPYRWHELKSLSWDELKAKLNPVPADLAPPGSEVIAYQPRLFQEASETLFNDLSPLLVAVDAEISRLGWSEATFSERLYQWFVKRELSSLIDDQLYELLELLREIGEPVEVAS